MAQDVYRVDGAMGEGGGQILRTACALAAAVGESIVVEDVRANRDNPGLKAQHVAALEGLKALTDGEVDGLHEGSDRVAFEPGPVQGGTVRVEVATAGSATLIQQCLLLAALGADEPVRLEVLGGTDVKWSPLWDGFEHVFVDHLQEMDLAVDAKLKRRGHYPEGGGETVATIEPGRPKAPDLAAPDRRERVAGIVHLTDLPDHIADRMRSAVLSELVDIETRIRIETGEGSTGTGIALWTLSRPRIGASALGEKGRPAEEVGEAAAKRMRRDLEAGVSVDVYTADQILPFLALADGPSSYMTREATGHLVTLGRLLGRMGVAKVRIEGQGPVTVRVEPEGVLGDGSG